jgi:hypothetical protein
MQCFQSVLRLVAMMIILMVSPIALGKQEVIVDELYCDAAALMAKAGAEAKQRGESLPKWRQNLLAMKGYGVRNKDNVLYRVLPKVYDEAPKVYRDRKTPMDTYMASYNSCMQNEYGLLITVN